MYSVIVVDLSLYLTLKIESAGCNVSAVGVKVKENSCAINGYI